MRTPRLFSASIPVSPTTAAIAPKAPIGASHMIIARIRKTSFCRYPTARRIGSPRAAQRLDGEADEQGDEQRLQHRPLGQGGEEGGRHQAEDEVDRAAALLGRPGEVGALTAQFVGELEAAAGVDDVADDQADGRARPST